MSFSFLKKEPMLSFVFDIRDSSISIAAVRFQKERKPEIVLCQSFEFKRQNIKDHGAHLSSMMKTLDDGAISVRKRLIRIGNKEKIGTHYFFVGSPWSVSQSKTLKITKGRSFEINNSLLEKIIVGEELLAESYLERQTKQKKWEILEERILQMKLNGFRVDDFFGKKASSLIIEHFVSFIPSELGNKISSFVDERLGKNIKRQSNSCILSSYSFLRDLYSDRNDFIYIDIGKLITDIYIVRDDIILGVASIPFGEEKIIETSLSKTNLSRDVFLSHLSIGHDKNFDLTSHNNGLDLLKTGFGLWEKNLKDVLLKTCSGVNMPNEMLIVPNDLISNMFISKLLNKGNDKQFKILNSSVKVSVITESEMNNFIINGRAFVSEPYIKMDLVFLDKLLKQ